MLRRAKERRQIVIVTRNANIAVLGDAEQIIVLKSQSDRGIITARGSIDDPETRDAACNILEGAREASSIAPRYTDWPDGISQSGQLRLVGGISLVVFMPEPSLPNLSLWQQK